MTAKQAPEGVGRPTPGTWLVHDTIDGPRSNTDVRDVRLRWVARCGAMLGRPHVSVQEAEANARLIAAAPELLEAAEHMLVAHESESATHYASAIAKLTAAIAKARGGSQ